MLGISQAPPNLGTSYPGQAGSCSVSTSNGTVSVTPQYVMLVPRVSQPSFYLF
jgi:hypothetical protein